MLLLLYVGYGSTHGQILVGDDTHLILKTIVVPFMGASLYCPVLMGDASMLVLGTIRLMYVGYNSTHGELLLAGDSHLILKSSVLPFLGGLYCPIIIGDASILILSTIMLLYVGCGSTHGQPFLYSGCHLIRKTTVLPFLGGLYCLVLMGDASMLVLSTIRLLFSTSDILSTLLMRFFRQIVVCTCQLLFKYECFRLFTVSNTNV